MGPRQGLLQPLDRARLPHFNNLDPRFLNQAFDPGNGHSVPYLWGTTGIGYDKLEAETAARIVNGVHYAGANQAAWPLIEEAIRSDPAIYPPQEVLDRCELIEDLGETLPLLEELWTEIKAQ